MAVISSPAIHKYMKRGVGRTSRTLCNVITSSAQKGSYSIAPSSPLISGSIYLLFRSKNHPLSIVLNELQTSAYQRIKKLLDDSNDAYLEPIDTLSRRKNNGIPSSHADSVDGNENNVSYDLDRSDPTLDKQYNLPETPHAKLNPDIVNVKDDGDNIVKIENDGDNIVNVGNDEDISIKDTYKSGKSISLERAFTELEDDMFSSDSEEEDSNIKNNSTSNPNETDGLTPNENGHKPIGLTLSNVTIKVSDLDGGDSYQVLEPGWETLKRNQEFIKSIPKNHTENENEQNDENDIINDPEGNKEIDTIAEVGSDGYMPLQDVIFDEYTELNTNDKENNDTDDSFYQELDNDDIVDDVYEDLDTKKPAIQEDIYEEITGMTVLIPQENKLSPEIQSRERLNSKKTFRRFSDECLRMIDSDYLKGVDNIVQDLRFGIDRIHSVLLLTYEGLDTPTGRDQSYATLEDIFFKALWPWIIRMFRQLNIHKEEAMLKVMRKFSSCEPKDMKVREKYCLIDKDVDGPQQPFKSAIDEMKLLRTYECPLEKLECTVRVSKTICHCVETYWLDKGEASPPSVGCDDLLPIISYVILKTRSPQIVSECHAMEEFIHEGYLMGEEGYCLTTLHAALSYLLSLSKECST